MKELEAVEVGQSLYLLLSSNGQPSLPSSLKQIEVQHQRWWNSLEWDNLFAEQPQPPILHSALSRQAAHMARISSPKSSLASTQVSSLIHRRGLAGGSDHHGPPKVNFWEEEDPMSPSKWKEEHFVIVSLTGWGLLFYGGYKFFTNCNDKKEEKIGEESH